MMNMLEEMSTIDVAMRRLVTEADEVEKLIKASTDLPNVLKLFKQLRDANERLEVSRKKFNTFLDFFSRNIIPDMMQEQGVKPYRLTTLVTVLPCRLK